MNNEHELEDFFPFCSQKGADTQNLKTIQMQQLAKQSKPLSQTDFSKILTEHYLFLSTGGVGGSWKTISVKGIVIGIYDKTSIEGQQANFDRKNLTLLKKTMNIVLPFANFCGCWAENMDFTHADLSYGLFADAMVAHTNFSQARLSNIDFSRANLEGCNFTHADLRSADFENCNLNYADFSGAKLEGAQFKGVSLKNIKY